MPRASDSRVRMIRTAARLFRTRADRAGGALAGHARARRYRGALVLARAERSGEPLETVGRELAALLRDRIPE